MKKHVNNAPTWWVVLGERYYRCRPRQTTSSLLVAEQYAPFPPLSDAFSLSLHNHIGVHLPFFRFSSDVHTRTHPHFRLYSVIYSWTYPDFWLSPNVYTRISLLFLLVFWNWTSQLDKKGQLLHYLTPVSFTVLFLASTSLQPETPHRGGASLLGQNTGRNSRGDGKFQGN